MCFIHQGIPNFPSGLGDAMTHLETSFQLKLPTSILKSSVKLCSTVEPYDV